MIRSDLIESKPRISFGIEGLDDLVNINSGLVLLKSLNQNLLFYLASKVLAEAVKSNKKALYLHFVNYHKRYWSFDVEKVLRIARHIGIRRDHFLRMVEIVRAFTNDQIEDDENWKIIKKAITKRLKVLVVDSISELYQGKNAMKLVKVYGRLKQLCLKKNLVAVVLDYLPNFLTHYLAHSSTIILEFYSRHSKVYACLIKHPSLPPKTMEFLFNGVISPVKKVGIWKWFDDNRRLVIPDRSSREWGRTLR